MSPVPLQGTYSPAIATRRRRGREGTCFQPNGWVSAGVLPVRMFDGLAYPDSSGNLVLWGATDAAGDNIYTSPVHYNTISGQCVIGTVIPVGFCPHAPAVQVGNLLYVFVAHSASLLSYNLDTKVWTTLAVAPRVRTDYFCLVDLGNGSIAAIGGVNGSGNLIPQLDIYSIAGNSWTTDTFLIAGNDSGKFGGLLLADGSVFATWAGFNVQNTIRWVPGVSISQQSNYIPRKMPVSFSGRYTQALVQAFFTNDGNIIMAGNPTNPTLLTIFRFSNTLGVVGQIAPPIPLVEAVGITRPSDGTSLMWNAYASQQGGNATAGFVTYNNGSMGTLDKLPSDKKVPIMAAHPTANKWFAFGGSLASDPSGTGTKDIYVINA